jgi:hypothetical protein
MFLSAEVMREYDQRFVYKKVFASKVDRGVMTNEGESRFSDRADGSRDGLVGKPRRPRLSSFTLGSPSKGKGGRHSPREDSNSGYYEL